MRLPEGHRLVHLSEADSTNAEAHRRYDAGERGPLWIWSDRQSAGRGRHGRRWVSKAGNLFVTLLLSPEVAPNVLAQLSFVASLAVREASAGYCDASRLTIKWPNDVLSDGCKYCGILVESPGTGCAAIGMGINLVQAPEGMPYPVTIIGVEDIDGFLEGLVFAMDRYLKLWDRGAGFASIRKRWMACAYGLGQCVTVGELSGRFLGLGPDGALLLADDSGVPISIHAGEALFADDPDERASLA